MIVCDQEFQRAHLRSLNLHSITKHYKKKFPDKAIFKKGYFSLFWFSLKQVLESEHEHLNCHRLLAVIKRRHFMYPYFLKKLSCDTFIHIKLLTSIIERKKLIICFHTKGFERFFQTKLHLVMKFCSFHTGKEFTCTQNYFHPGTSFYFLFLFFFFFSLLSLFFYKAIMVFETFKIDSNKQK